MADLTEADLDAFEQRAHENAPSYCPIHQNEIFPLIAAAREGLAGRRLREAVKGVYYAAHWTPDRDCDAGGLWTALRDAAGFEKGHAPAEARNGDIVHDAGTKERETNHNLYSSDKIQSEQESEDAEFHKELRAGREQGRGLPDNQLDPSCGDAGVAAGAEPVAPSPSVGELITKLENYGMMLTDEAATTLKQQAGELNATEETARRWMKHHKDRELENASLRAEIERLREALENIVLHYSKMPGIRDSDDPYFLARAALRESEGK